MDRWMAMATTSSTTFWRGIKMIHKICTFNNRVQESPHIPILMKINADNIVLYVCKIIVICVPWVVRDIVWLSDSWVHTVESTDAEPDDVTSRSYISQSGLLSLAEPGHGTQAGICVLSPWFSSYTWSLIP